MKTLSHIAETLTAAGFRVVLSQSTLRKDRPIAGSRLVTRGPAKTYTRIMVWRGSDLLINAVPGFDGSRVKDIAGRAGLLIARSSRG